MLCRLQGNETTKEHSFLPGLSVLRNNLKRWLTWPPVLGEDQFKFSVDNKLLFSVVFEEPRNSTVQYFWLLVRQTSSSALCGMLPSNLSWNIVSRMTYYKRVTFDFDSRLWSCWGVFWNDGYGINKKERKQSNLNPSHFRHISTARMTQDKPKRLVQVILWTKLCWKFSLLIMSELTLEKNFPCLLNEQSQFLLTQTQMPYLGVSGILWKWLRYVLNLHF